MDFVLRDPSIARRKSREDSKLMRRDPRIEAPLKKRKLAVVQLKWSIMPEDEEDEGQVEAAKQLTSLIEAFDFAELLENLLEAVWYGPGPAELVVSYDEREGLYKIDRTLAIHGDSVVFDAFGEPLLRVGAGYTGKDVIFGWESRVRHLNQVERELFVLHTFNPSAAEFFTPEESALVFHGTGLREDVWHYWWLSHHIHKQWVYFLERYAGGIVVIAHPDTAGGREAAEVAVRDYKDGNFLLVPIPGDATDIKAFDIQIKEAPSNTSQLFLEYVDGFTGGYIKRIIEGQILTSEAAPTGLGSGVAKAHENTFQMYVEYDARRLARTITTQVVARLQRWNNILPDVRFNFEFAIDEVSKKETMEAVHLAHSMGVRFKEDDVRDITGLGRPDDEDDVIGGEMMGQLTGEAGNVSGPLGGGFEGPVASRLSGLLDEEPKPTNGESE